MRNERKIYALAMALLVAAAVTASPATAQLSDRCRASLAMTLKELHDYDLAAGTAPLEKLHVFVMTHKADPGARAETEQRLDEFIAANPSPVGLQAACRGLRLIGTKASVPVLESLLLKEGRADQARFALEKIPGSEAMNALIGALGKTSDSLKLGVISSLGDRGDAAAVKPLAAIAEGRDTEAAAAAANALGKIGGSEALGVLEGLLKKGSEPAAEALIASADRLAKTGPAADAGAVYDKVLAAGTGVQVRQAAFRGKLGLAGAEGRTLVKKTLDGRDATLYAPAIAAIPEYYDQASIAEVVPCMDKLPPADIVQLTAVLAGYPGTEAAKAVIAAASNKSQAVRLEALRDIEKVGGPASVGSLAEACATRRGAEQNAARISLWRMKGGEVDKAVADMLAEAKEEAVKAELIQAAGERRIAEAKPALLAVLGSKDASTALKLKAAVAVRSVSDAADIPSLVSILLATEDETVREAMQDTAASVALSDPKPGSRSGYVADLCRAEKDARRKSDLLRVLGKIGEDSSLPVIRAELGSTDATINDAAVRALADWPTVSARDDLVGVASSTADAAHKVLAIRALVRLVGLEPYRQPAAAVADLKKYLGLSDRAEEKKLVLAGLAKFPCDGSLKLAESLAADPALKAEAEAAAVRIRKLLGRS